MVIRHPLAVARVARGADGLPRPVVDHELAGWRLAHRGPGAAAVVYGCDISQRSAQQGTTALTLAAAMGGSAEAFVALNEVTYIGLKQDSKLQRGTIILVPK